MFDKKIVTFFWGHIKPYKWLYFVMLMAPIISSFYPFAYNYAIKMFLDVMDVDGYLSYKNILFPVILFLATQIILDVVWRISNIAEWKAEPYVRRSLLLNSYNYTQNHSYQFFQDNFSGTISSKIKGILDGYDKFWAEMHHGLLQRVFKIVVNLTALCFVNIKLGIFVICWGAIYLPVIYRLSLKLNKLSFYESESRHRLLGSISDKITNIISIISFASKKREYEDLHKKISEDFIPKQIKTYKYDFKMQIIAGLMYWFMFAFILFYMIHLKNNGMITIGDFAFVFGLSLIVAEDIWHTTVSLQDFARAMGDLKSALSILDIPNDNVDVNNAKSIDLKAPKIEIKGVSFGYGENKNVFDNLNVVINPGEKVGLVGHSGSGKTTLINLLLRYFTVKNGEILIDEQNINLLTQDSLREQIAIIPQDTMLFHRTLLDNIQYGKPDADYADIEEASKKAYLHEYILSLPDKYNSYVGERGLKLSGGQRQRIAIARAILKNAKILILDEATSSLDSHTEKQIQDSLNFFISNKEKTVIAIAHRLSTLKHMDRILVLDKGDVVEQGTHDELISDSNSIYKKLWELQEI